MKKPITTIAITLFDDGSIRSRTKCQPSVDEYQQIASHFVHAVATSAAEGWDVAVEKILRDAAKIKRIDGK